jgi:hypothetical protein
MTAVKPAKAATAVALRQQRHRARRAAAHQVELIRVDWPSYFYPDRHPQKAGYILNSALRPLVERVDIEGPDDPDDGPNGGGGHATRLAA